MLRRKIQRTVEEELFQQQRREKRRKNQQLRREIAKTETVDHMNQRVVCVAGTLHDNRIIALNDEITREVINVLEVEEITVV